MDIEEVTRRLIELDSQLRTANEGETFTLRAGEAPSYEYFHSSLLVAASMLKSIDECFGNPQEQVFQGLRAIAQGMAGSAEQFDIPAETHVDYADRVVDPEVDQ